MTGPEVARRFEAVVLVGDEAVADAGVVASLGALALEGMAVAVITGHDLASLGPLLEGVHGPGLVAFAAAHGADRVVIDAGAAHVLASPTADLDLVSTALVDRLRDLGAAATAERSPSAATVVLTIPSDADAPPGAVAAIVSSAARDLGLADVRVRAEPARVVVTLEREVDAVQWALDALWDAGIAPADVLVVDDGSAQGRDRARLLSGVADPATVVSLPGGAAVGDLLVEQVQRREAREVPRAARTPCWSVAFDGYDDSTERGCAAMLTIADGHVGSAGALVPADGVAHRPVLAIGVYDGENAASHLLTGPIALHLPYTITPDHLLRRVLDLRTGTLHELAVVDGGGTLTTVRFAARDRPATVVMRAACPDGRALPALQPPADDPVADEGTSDGVAWMRARASNGGGIAAASLDRDHRSSEGRVVDRVAAYAADPDALPEPGQAVEKASEASAVGFEPLLVEHRRAWAARWNDADVVVEGDDDLQTAIRFNLFHLMSSVPDTGEAAVGARGLTGSAYRGHVFWDADTYVLPFLAATHPPAARAMLEYRVRRLDAALATAEALGRKGARFPWESARSGFDVTPASARDRTGRLVAIRTGVHEEHIVAQVAWAACCYSDWTGDREFALGDGLRLLIETARYWASGARIDRDGAAHLFGVIGPDEYHEPVDDNAFTNVIARWNLRRAAAEAEAAGPDVVGRWGVTPDELAGWRTIAAALVDGYDPDTGIYEQFSGFYRLEPLIIREVAPRRPIAADLLLGADRVHRSQVVKQADVLLLHHLVPDEVAPGSLGPNLRYYEPRTAHGSSLSPAIHAALFARDRDYEQALASLTMAARLDLDDLTGTTGGGLHLATMGAVWQAMAYGFAGMRPEAETLRLDPRLPPQWAAWEMRVRYRGSRVHVRKDRGVLSVAADPAIPVVVEGARFTAPPGGVTLVHRRGHAWEVQP